MKITDQILKTDVLGRVTRPSEKREQILDEFERSGLKGVPFAKLIGVNYQTFASWIAARRRARGDYQRMGRVKKPKAPCVPPTRWIEAVADQRIPEVAPDAKSLGLVVHLPGGGSMEVNDPAQVALAAQGIQQLQKASPTC